MADNDTTITVRVDDQGTLKFFDALGKEIRAVENEASKAASSGGGIGGLSTAFGAFAGVVAGGAVLALGGFVSKVISSIDPIETLFSAIDRADAVDDISGAFEKLTAQAGGVADAFTEELQKATKGTISEFELMKLANDALIAGLKPDAITTLAGAAKQLSDTLGVETKQAFDNLSKSIESGRTAALRQYGVFVDSQKVIEDYAKSQVKAGQSVKDVADAIDEQTKIQLIQGAVIDQISKKYGKVEQGSQSLKDKLEILSAAWENVKNAASKFVEYLPFIGKGLDVLIAGFNAAADAIKTWGTRIDSIVKFATLSVERRLIELSVNGRRALQDIPFLGSSPGATAQLKDAEAQLAKIDKDLYGIGLNIITAAPPSIELGKALEEVAKQGAEIPKEIAKVPTAIAEAAKAAKSSPIEVPVVLGAKRIGAGGAGDPVAESFDLGQEMGKALSSGLNSFLEGDIKGGFASLAGSLGASGGAAIGGSIGGPIGAQIGSQLGQVLGEKLVDGIASFFGKDSAGTTFRKNVDKFFADAFDANRLLVIIDGQLQAIKDLDLGGSEFGNAGAGFFDALKNLSPEAQSAFNGVALGFAGLQEDGIEFATNLAAALTNNVGGSLNNLQLLVQASGKSFEELRGTVVEAFLDGQLSALEAQTALQGIQNLAEDGIPGALGAAGEAFDNLVASSAKGGRASTDALRDIGAEAKELGLKTIPQLISYLVNTAGKSSESVQQVMAALATYGIDSIDEISKATDEQLIPVLANLQANGFNFAAATDSVNDLTTQLEKLPSSKDVQINIKVNTTKEGQEALKNAVAVQGSSSGGRQFFGNANQ